MQTDEHGRTEPRAAPQGVRGRAPLMVPPLPVLGGVALGAAPLRPGVPLWPGPLVAALLVAGPWPGCEAGVVVAAAAAAAGAGRAGRGHADAAPHVKPSGHAIAALEPAGQNVPSAHGDGAVAPAEQVLPAGHARGRAARAGHMDPAGHAIG